MTITTWPSGSGSSYTGPSISVSTSTWPMNLLQTDGTSIISSAFESGSYYTIGNLVVVSMYIQILTAEITAAEEMRFEIDLPISTGFPTNNEIQGSAQMAIQTNSYWLPGMSASVSSDRVDNKLALYLYIPDVIPDSSAIYIAVNYNYNVLG